MNKLFVFSLFFMVFGCSSNPVVEEARIDVVDGETALAVNENNTALILQSSGLLEEIRSNSAFDSEELELALRNMLSRLVRSSDEAKNEESGWVEGIYLVKRGDTLSAIVRDAVKGTQIRPDFILNAIVKVNPSAFVRGNPNWMLAGKKLKFPRAEDFNRLVFVKSTDRDMSLNESDPYLGWIKYP